MKKVARYRRRREAKVKHWNPWDLDAEPGDLMVDELGRLFRLEENSKSCGGELYPRRVLPPQDGLRAAIIGGEVWWVAVESD